MGVGISVKREQYKEKHAGENRSGESSKLQGIREECLRAKAREGGMNQHSQCFRYHVQKFGLYTTDSR